MYQEAPQPDAHVALQQKKAGLLEVAFWVGVSFGLTLRVQGVGWTLLGLGFGFLASGV